MNVTAIGSILQRQAIEAVMETTVLAFPKPNAPEISNTACLSPKSIVWLWEQMTAIYGKPFLNRHGVQDKDNTWYLALRDLTTKALESGVARLRGLSNEGKFTEFAPNCLQFKALCLAYYEDLSLPSAADAYREITNSQYATSHYRWSHSVVKSIASRLPNDFLNRDNQAEGYALFKTMYERVCHLVKQGHSLFEIASLKEPVLRLEKPRNKQTALNHLKAMKQQLGVQA